MEFTDFVTLLVRDGGGYDYGRVEAGNRHVSGMSCRGLNAHNTYTAPCTCTGMFDVIVLDP